MQESWKARCFHAIRLGNLCVFWGLFVASTILGLMATTEEEGYSGTGFYSTYRYNLVFFSRGRAVREDVSFRAGQYEQCSLDEAESRSSTVLRQGWDVGSFSATPVLQDKVFVNTWNMLPIIFLVSGTAETVRLYWLHPTDPDARFLRWVEYALTSPLMLVIIALSGFLRERAILVLLATGQFALIFFGHLLEIELERARSGFVFATIGLAAWFLHAVLWLAVLIPLSVHNIETALPCGQWSAEGGSADFDTLKVVFRALLFCEFTLFSLFGTALPLALAQQWRVLYHTGLAGLDLSRVWATQEVVYTVLNVSSKALLFVLCALIVFQMPPEISFATAPRNLGNRERLYDLVENNYSTPI